MFFLSTNYFMRTSRGSSDSMLGECCVEYIIRHSIFLTSSSLRWVWYAFVYLLSLLCDPLSKKYVRFELDFSLHTSHVSRTFFIGEFYCEISSYWSETDHCFHGRSLHTNMRTKASLCFIQLYSTVLVNLFIQLSSLFILCWPICSYWFFLY